MENRPYQNLAAAIVLKAVEDYKDVLKTIRKNKVNGEKVSPKTIAKLEDLEEFFDSDWCDTLCGFDGNIIKDRITKKRSRKTRAHGTERI